MKQRAEIKYIKNHSANLSVLRGKKLTLPMLLRAIRRFDATIALLYKSEVDIALLLGLRNLSAFVGEVFASSLIAESKGMFIKNPHQDGYPDLLLMDKKGKNLYLKLRDKLREKSPFSPFKEGGVEVKATIGSVPPPSFYTKRGINKPDIGDKRIDYLKGYDWKAHHRDTKNLLGIVWDFENGKPVIVGVFFGNRLQTNHWRKIVKPKEGGGRTTSVSVMERSGIRLMYRNWLLVIDDSRYIDFFNRFNSASAIPKSTRSSHRK